MGHHIGAPVGWKGAQSPTPPAILGTIDVAMSHLPTTHLTRRGALQVGSLGAIGLDLPGLLAAGPTRSANAPAAKSCILFYMEGGPSHIDLWDMKPQAPAAVRGQVRPSSTSLPGARLPQSIGLKASNPSPAPRRTGITSCSSLAM